MTKRQAYASKLAFSIVSIDQGTTHPGRPLFAVQMTASANAKPPALRRGLVVCSGADARNQSEWSRLELPSGRSAERWCRQ